MPYAPSELKLLAFILEWRMLSFGWTVCYEVGLPIWPAHFCYYRYHCLTTGFLFYQENFWYGHFFIPIRSKTSIWVCIQSLQFVITVYSNERTLLACSNIIYCFGYVHSFWLSFLGIGRKPVNSITNPVTFICVLWLLLERDLPVALDVQMLIPFNLAEMDR